MARTEEERKALRKERNKRYYEKHKEEILEKNNQYKSEHNDDLKLYNREYNKTRNDPNDNRDNSYKRWTGKERVKLVEMKIVQEKSVKEIADKLQRSEKSIRNELINDRNDYMIEQCKEYKEYYDSFFLQR